MRDTTAERETERDTERWRYDGKERERPERKKLPFMRDRELETKRQHIDAAGGCISRQASIDREKETETLEMERQRETWRHKDRQPARESTKRQRDTATQKMNRPYEQTRRPEPQINEEGDRMRVKKKQPPGRGH